MTTRAIIMTKKLLNPVHPGEMLLKQCLKPMAPSENRPARDIGVSRRRINEIVLGKRRITAETELRLARHFNMSPQFRLKLQLGYELDVEMDRLDERLKTEMSRRRQAG